MAAAQVGAEPSLTPIFKQRGDLLERQIGRLQKKDELDSPA